MYLVVSFCNVKAPGLPALGVFDPRTASFHVVALPASIPPLHGITGLAANAEHFFMVAQATETVDNSN